MLKRLAFIIFSFFVSVFYPEKFHAQGNKTGSTPPAVVVVSEVQSGLVTPEASFVGTVFYPEVSEVAAEVSGRIEAVHFEEGQRIRKGFELVRLDADLLKKILEGTVASHEQVISDLEKARSDYNRMENLFKRQVIPEQAFDEHRFRVKGLEKRAASLMAEVERLKIELDKKRVRSPFDGIVVKKQVDRGEWLSSGSPVATVARDDVVDILVEVPENILRWVRTGMDIPVKAGGGEIQGKVFAIVPRGDIPTRTFPMKVRVGNSLSLIEGMEAKVSLPTGASKKSLIVPRDALINLSGENVVFTVESSKVSMRPVKVVGYQGNRVGIEGEGLSQGMSVVVKGNERLRDGQSITILQPRKQ
jgi:RND family efflux transporter MFP subunit